MRRPPFPRHRWSHLLPLTLWLLVSWSAHPLCNHAPSDKVGDGPSSPTSTGTPRAHSVSQGPPNRTTVRVASANVTSLRGSWDLITTMHFDLLALQEIRIVDVPLWQRLAIKEGMTLSVLPLSSGEEHLVGYLHRRGSLCTQVLHSPLPANRVHMATWHCDDGPPILL